MKLENELIVHADCHDALKWFVCGSDISNWVRHEEFELVSVLEARYVFPSYRLVKEKEIERLTWRHPGIRFEWRWRFVSATGPEGECLAHGVVKMGQDEDTVRECHFQGSWGMAYLEAKVAESAD